MKNKKYYYIYKITILRGSLKDHYYIGKRVSTIIPEEDIEYNGSGKKIKDWFNSKERISGVDYIKEIIHLCKDKNDLKKMEIYYIGDKWKDEYPECLNLKEGGDGGHLSKETIQKIKSTKSQKSPEEKAETGRKMWITRKSNPKKYQESIEKTRETNAKKSPEEKAEQYRKQKEAKASKLPEINNKIRESNKKAWDNKSKEEINEIVRRREETNTKKSPEKKAEENRRRGESMKATVAKKSPEEKAEQYRKQKETNTKKSPEKKAEENRKRQETINKDPEKKAEDYKRRVNTRKKTMNEKSQEEKAESIRKMKETKSKKSPEKKAEENRKRQETNAKKSPEKKAEESSKISKGVSEASKGTKLMTDGNGKPKKIKIEKIPEYEAMGWYLCDRKGNKINKKLSKADRIKIVKKLGNNKYSTKWVTKEELPYYESINYYVKVA